MPKDLNGKKLPKGIYQRKDGRYEARAVIDGNKIQLYNFNLKQLKKDFEETKASVRLGLVGRWVNVTLDEWFEEWFCRYKIPSMKETSVKPSEAKYKRYFGKMLGEMKVSDIRNIHIQEVINEMSRGGRASSTMRDALGQIRECLEVARRNHIILENPCFDTNVPWSASSTRQWRFLTQEEQNKFLRQVDDSWYKEMFYVMFLTGMRVGEIGGLKWEDIDFRTKTITVRRSLSAQYYGGEKVLQLTSPKTYNSNRKIPFMGETEEMLLSQRQKQEILKKELGKRYRCDGEFANLVFTSTMGSPLMRHIAEKECKKVVKAINEQEALDAVREQREPVIFETVYPHAIRHTFCTRCFQKGIEPKVVQALMGHQHYSTTVDIYTHVMGIDLSEAAQKLQSALTEE